jgi:hypothetical protein
MEEQENQANRYSTSETKNNCNEISYKHAYKQNHQMQIFNKLFHLIQQIICFTSFVILFQPEFSYLKHHGQEIITDY